MAFLEKNLLIKESTLPGAGRGLFTKIEITAGTRIVEYKGRVTTWKEVKHDVDNGYLYVVNDGFVIDAGKALKALARYANDASGLVRVKGIRNNSKYVNEEGKVFIDAIRTIPAGSEILVRYGKEYWDVVRHNLAVEKKNAKKK